MAVFGRMQPVFVKQIVDQKPEMTVWPFFLAQAVWTEHKRHPGSLRVNLPGVSLRTLKKWVVITQNHGWVLDPFLIRVLRETPGAQILGVDSDSILFKNPAVSPGLLMVS